MIKYISIIMLVPFAAHADVLDVVNSAIAWAQSPIGLMVLGFAVDRALALWPSSKAWGLLHLAGGLLARLGQVCVNLGNLVDSVFGQKLK